MEFHLITVRRHGGKQVTDKFDSYTEIMNVLVAEAISCSPESWNNGTLTVECDGSYMNYKLRNDGSSEKAQISGELRSLCEEFYVVMRQAGDVWLEAIIHFFRKDDSWSFKAEFKYPEPAVVSEPEVSPEPTIESKPWWKLW